MTDWTAIARALDAVARREAHEQTCEYWGEHRFRHDCMCDHAQRVREAQARAVLRAIEASMWCAASHGHMPDVAAALRALDTTEAVKALRGDP